MWFRCSMKIHIRWYYVNFAKTDLRACCTAGTNKILICGSTHKESLILELLIQQCRKSISHPLTQPMQLSFSLLCQRFLFFIPTHSWLPSSQERNVTQLCFLLREVVNDFLLKCGEMVSHFVNNFITREPGAMADKTPDLCQFAVWKLKKKDRYLITIWSNLGELFFCLYTYWKKTIIGISEGSFYPECCIVFFPSFQTGIPYKL